MQKKVKIVLWAVLVALMTAGIVYILQGFSLNDVVVLASKGEIGVKQRSLFWTATWLMCIVVIPVFVMSVVFAWKYRANQQKATYRPEWAHSYLLECIWWGVPCLIIVILAVITFRSSHELDPFKPLVAKEEPITIQVVALEWKWLFIYPKEGIATINFIQFPQNVPIQFEITADAPMNSFWIPQLGGQIYAMPAMRTQLHLIANESGVFRGCSAHISGEGFAGMVFAAKASDRQEFNQWVSSIKKEKSSLTWNEYQNLIEPTAYDPVRFYGSVETGLFDEIINQYTNQMQMETACLED